MSFYTLSSDRTRWLADVHPEMADPALWTREMAAESMAAIDRMKVGESHAMRNEVVRRISGRK
jgi:hypothetical protein